MNLNKFAMAAVFGLSLPACYAADYTAQTAPDAVSKAVLANQVMRPEEGAMNSDDIAPAIHRNFPRIIEQGLARRDPTEAAAWIDRLTDIELDDLAQTYVNANASAARSGKLLHIAAARLDTAHLARLAKFFGHAEMRAAVSHVAPKKLRSFEAVSSAAFLAPVAGAALKSVPIMMRTSSAGGVGEAGVMASGSFTPSVSMTLEEIYLGFRSMQVGSMAVTGAIYETAAYAGIELYAAWTGGYWFGGEITGLMIKYEPDFYYDQFVPWVGDTATWVQNLVSTTHSLTPRPSDWGQYQSTTMPTMGTTYTQTSSMGSMGGDWGTEAGYETFESGSGGSGKSCPPATCKIDMQ